MPPTAPPTTGLPFQIASATVRPKPSAWLFWTTTVAWLCSALTITAFSSGSAIGQADQLDPAACEVGRQLAPLPPDAPPFVRRDRVVTRCSSTTVPAARGARPCRREKTCFDEAVHDSRHVLERVPNATPARRADIVGSGRRSRLRHVDASVDPAGCTVAAARRELRGRRRRRQMRSRAARRSPRTSVSARHALVLGR